MPPTDGSILLPDTLTFHRKNNANTPVYLYMEDDAEDVTQVTYEQLDRACHRVVQSIGANIDSSTRPVVALLVLADTLVYQTIVAGIMLAGYIVSLSPYLMQNTIFTTGTKPFPISPRNTAAAIVNLLRTTSCHYVAATCLTLKDLVYDILRELEHVDSTYRLIIEEAPTLLKLFPDHHGFQECEPDPPCSFPAGGPTVNIDDVALYLHSSGSTGYPKAIPKSHRTILEYVTSRESHTLNNSILA